MSSDDSFDDPSFEEYSSHDSSDDDSGGSAVARSQPQTGSVSRSGSFIVSDEYDDEDSTIKKPAAKKPNKKKALPKKGAQGATNLIPGRSVVLPSQADRAAARLQQNAYAGRAKRARPQGGAILDLTGSPEWKKKPLDSDEEDEAPMRATSRQPTKKTRSQRNESEEEDEEDNSPELIDSDEDDIGMSLDTSAIVHTHGRPPRATAKDTVSKIKSIRQDEDSDPSSKKTNKNAPVLHTSKKRKLIQLGSESEESQRSFTLRKEDEELSSINSEDIEIDIDRPQVKGNVHRGKRIKISEKKEAVTLFDDESSSDANQELVRIDEESEEEDDPGSKRGTKVNDIRSILANCEERAAKVRKSLLERHLTAMVLAAEDHEESENGQWLLQPKCITGTMKAHQISAMNWLWALFLLKLGAILADDMGLGKTLSTISFIATLKEKGLDRGHGPHLVVVTPSTLEQWKMEFELWYPTCKVCVYQGPPPKRSKILKRDDYDVLLVSYSLIATKKDRAPLRRKGMTPWHLVVLDEAHILRSDDAQKTRLLIGFRTELFLLLTGTPVQNSLPEFWTLIQFVSVPRDATSSGKLIPFTDLLAAFDDDGRDGSDESKLASRLRALMKLHTLRRLKSELLETLLPKEREPLMLDLTPVQRESYDQVHSNARNTDRRVKLENALMELRKICISNLMVRRRFDDAAVAAISRVEAVDANASDWELHRICAEAEDPDLRELALVDEKDDDAVIDLLCNSSAKLNTLRNLLPKLRGEGHRMLLFSQMTRPLDLVARLLDALHIRYVRLDGDTQVNKRQSIVEEFSNDPSIGVFLLSTRSGGVGLNLIAADTVIFLDLDFNPMNDRQAEDRAHRLGQTKNVRIYTMVAKGTCEEQIVMMREAKSDMVDCLMSEGQFEAKRKGAKAVSSEEGGMDMDEDDLRRLFGDLFAVEVEDNASMQGLSFARPSLLSPVMTQAPIANGPVAKAQASPARRSKATVHRLRDNSTKPLPKLDKASAKPKSSAKTGSKLAFLIDLVSDSQEEKKAPLVEADEDVSELNDENLDANQSLNDTPDLTAVATIDEASVLLRPTHPVPAKAKASPKDRPSAARQAFIEENFDD